MAKIHNENNNIYQYKLKSSKYYLASFIIYIILININGMLCESFISVKMKNKGKYKILFQGGVQNKSHICFGVSIHNPENATVNGNKIEFDSPGEYYFKDETKTINLFFSENKNDFTCIFYGCSGISEIDLSNLSTLNVLNLKAMFYGCSSLVSIKFGNFKGENITNMNEMFH